MGFSILFLLIGLALTATATPAVLESFPRMAPELLHSSRLPCLLVDAAMRWAPGDPNSAGAISGTISGVISGARETTDAVPLHPLAISGFIGMFTNSLAAMPLGQLDGGRAAAACFGREKAQFLSLIAIWLLLSDSFLNLDQPFLFELWAVTALLPSLLQRGELPALEEATPPPGERVWVFSLLLMLAQLCLEPMHLDLSLSFAEKFASSGIEGVL
jgi:membrane-associated protease RseP (regulator of RpoE activity)